jgi:hypothetical protein
MFGSARTGFGSVRTAGGDDATSSGGGGTGGGGPIWTGTGQLLTNAGGARFAYFGDPGSDFNNTVDPADDYVNPNLYPSQARTFRAMFVSLLLGPVSHADLVFTLYQNGAPTGQVVSLPVGTAAGSVLFDTAHPIVFVDGDRWDVQAHSAANAEGALYRFSVTLEGVSPGNPPFGPAPPAVQLFSQQGVAPFVSRSDHTHAQDFIPYFPSVPGMQLTGVVQQVFGGGIATPSTRNMANGVIPFGNGGILDQDGHLNWFHGGQALGIGIALGSIGAPLHVNTQGASPAMILGNPNAVGVGSTMISWQFAGLEIHRMFVNLAHGGDVIFAGPDVVTGLFGNWTFEKNSGGSGAVGVFTVGGLGAIVGGNVGFGSTEGTLEIVAENILGTGASDLTGNQQIAIALSGNFAQTIKKTNTKGGPLPGGTTPDLTIVQTVGGATFNLSHTGGQGIGNVINIIRNGTTVGQWDRIGTFFLTTLVNTSNDQPSTLVVTARAHTGQALVEIPDFVFDGSATLTFVGAGVIPLIRGTLFNSRTYADSVAGGIIVDAATVGIDDAPIQGANMTILNRWALHVRRGATLLQNLAHAGTLLGFYATAPVAKQTINGSRAGNAAVQSIAAALATIGLFTDATTP